MRRLFLFLILALLVASPCWGQVSTMEQIPTQSWGIWDAVETLHSSKDIVVGQVLWVTYHTRAPSVGPTIADTLLSSWTKKLDINGADGRDHFYLWTAKAASAGPDTVNITVTGTQDHVLFFCAWNNLTETVDDSATSQSGFSGGSVTLPTVVTHKYRDLIVNFAQSVGGQIMCPHANSGYQPLFTADGGDNSYIQYIIGGNPGTITNTLDGDSSNRDVALATIAFVSSASLAVSTGSIPKAIVNQSYSFQLGAKGGAGTNSWSITTGTLPTGLSLSSGGVISGTPTFSGLGNVVFEVTDSLAATATASLAVPVGNLADTVGHIQAKTGPFNIAMTSDVTAPHALVVSLLGYSSNKIVTPALTDTQGTIFYPLPATAMAEVQNSAFTVNYIGFVTSSGPDTISCVGTCGSGLVTELSNVQQVFDTTVTSIMNSTSCGATITSTAITSPVAETLFGVAGTITSGSVATPNSPFLSSNNLSNTTGDFSSAYAIGASAGSNSASWGVTGNTNNVCMIALWGLRPTSTGTAPTPGGNHPRVIGPY